MKMREPFFGNSFRMIYSFKVGWYGTIRCMKLVMIKVPALSFPARVWARPVLIGLENSQSRLWVHATRTSAILALLGAK
jgi:hypothetical protein